MYQLMYIHSCDEVPPMLHSNASFYSAHDDSDYQLHYSPHNSLTKFKSLSTNIKRKAVKPTKAKDYILIKDEFYSCSKQTTQLLLCNSHCRFSKKDEAMRRRIEQYIHGFVEGRKYKRQRRVYVEQRMQLYLLLKRECEMDLTALMRAAVQCLEERYEAMVGMCPARVLVRWKNNLLHELVAAHSFLCQVTLDAGHNHGNQYHEDKCPPPPLCLPDHSHHQYISAFLALLQEYHNGEDCLEYSQLHFSDKRNCKGNPRTAETVAPLLTDDVFVEFSKQMSPALRSMFFKGKGEVEEEEEDYMHVYNKAIFDALDQHISKRITKETALQTSIYNLQLQQKQSFQGLNLQNSRGYQLQKIQEVTYNDREFVVEVNLILAKMIEQVLFKEISYQAKRRLK